MNLLDRVRYCLAARRCLAWRPPPGVAHAVVIDPRMVRLSVQIAVRGEYEGELTVDLSRPPAVLYALLEATARFLIAEAARDRREPELAWE